MSTYEEELQAREIRQRRWDDVVAKAIVTVAAHARKSGVNLYTQLHYGAMGIDPKHLAIWYIAPTDAELQTFKTTGICRDLNAATKKELSSAGYPEEALATIHIGCESHESIMRETGGDYFHYFK